MTKHNGELSQLSAIREDLNDVIFQRTDPRTLADEQLGGYGRDLINQRDTQSVRGSLSYVWGRHTFKGGAEYSQNLNFRDTLYIGSEKSLYTSLASIYAATGVTAGQFSTGNWSDSVWDVNNPSDFGGFIREIDNRPDRASFYSALDLNNDGTITSAEAAQGMVWQSVAGNPHGQVNYARTLQAATGPQETKSKGLSIFPGCRHVGPAHAQRGAARGTLGALRDHGREHLHVPVGVRAAPERRLRRARRRPAEALRLLGPVLRSDPEQHDQLRRHPHRLDPRGAGVGL